ncbi:MAG: hypothetical protein ACKOBO_06555 [Acidimicrobiales bacterium]
MSRVWRADQLPEKRGCLFSTNAAAASRPTSNALFTFAFMFCSAIGARVVDRAGNVSKWVTVTVK